MRLKVFKRILLSSFVFIPFFAQAQEFETIVEETIFNSSDRVVIERDQIEKSKAPNLSSLLSAQANLTVTTTSFQPTSLYLRGGDSSHIIMLVDGVPFYDGTSTQRSFNLNSLDIRTVERVEIIKGSQSVLFGGQALSGVIKITTLGAKARKTTVVAEAGSFDKANLGVAYQKDLESGLFSARARVGQKNARSPLLDSDSIYPSNNTSTDLAYRYEADWFVQGKLSYIADDSYSPSQNLQRQTIDADDFKIKNQQTAVSVVAGAKNVWKPQALVSHQWSYRNYNQPSAVPSAVDDDYIGETTQARFESNLLNLEGKSLVAGLSYTKESMIHKSFGVEDVDVYSEIQGVFLKYDQILSPEFKFSIGGRYESWDSEDGATTGQIGLVYRDQTKLEISTGFKVPSLFQRFSPDYGNTDLGAERSVSYSISHQQAFSETMNGSLTLFLTQFSDLIVATGSPPNFQYNNVTKSNTRGVEAAYSWNFATNQNISVLGTYQEPWDETNKRWLLRRPLLSGSLRYGINSGPWQNYFEFVAVGTRADSGGDAPGYAVANVSSTYDISDVYSAYVRLDNIANYRYQESYSYYSEGFSATLGLAARF